MRERVTSIISLHTTSLCHGQRYLALPVFFWPECDQNDKNERINTKRTIDPLNERVAERRRNQVIEEFVEMLVPMKNHLVFIGSRRFVEAF